MSAYGATASSIRAIWLLHKQRISLLKHACAAVGSTTFGLKGIEQHKRCTGSAADNMTAHCCLHAPNCRHHCTFDGLTCWKNLTIWLQHGSNVMRLTGLLPFLMPGVQSCGVHFYKCVMEGRAETEAVTCDATMAASTLMTKIGQKTGAGMLL